MFKENNPLASQLLTAHNLCYMMTLMRTMRQAILQGEEAFENFVREFLRRQFPQGNIPLWVVEALREAGIFIETTVTSNREEERERREGEGEGEEE